MKVEVKSVTKVAFNDERIVIVGHGFEGTLRLFNHEDHGKIKVGDDFLDQLNNIHPIDRNSFFGRLSLGTDADDEKVIALENEIIDLQRSRDSNQKDLEDLVSEKETLSEKLNSSNTAFKSLTLANQDLATQLSSRDSFIASVEKENNALREKIGELSAAAEKKRAGK